MNCKVPQNEIGLKDEVEEKFYESLIEQAEEHYKKYGFYPTFEVDEIEYDDPCLDIKKDEN